jgi:site-specific DNA recombinase
MKIAFLYARLSTDEQAKKDLSIPFQVAKIEEYAVAHSYVIPNECKFLDQGESGNSMKRPGVKRLLGQVAEGAPAAILYLDEDRWTRTMTGSMCAKASGSRASDAWKSRPETAIPTII